MLPSPSPLRTVHETFTSHSSSLWKGLPYGDSRKLIKFTSCYTNDCRNNPKAYKAHQPKPSFAFPAFIRFDQISHEQRPVGRLLTFVPGKFWPVSNPLQDDIRFFRHLNPTPPTACLAVCLPLRRKYWVSTFHIYDPANDLGVPWTPVVRQFRAGTLETCILTTYRSHRGAVFDLISLSRSVAA